MAQLTVPSAPKEYATHYKQLLGVDYLSDQTEVDRRRSPDMVNMISDFGGNPVKRDGYRKVASGIDALVVVDGVTYSIRAASSVTTISTAVMDGYTLSETVVGQYLGNIGTVREVFTYQKTIYIIGTKCLLAFDTETKNKKLAGVGASQMSSGAIGESAPVNPDDIPLTIINLKPDGTDGTTLYDKNLMSIYQQVSYKGDGTTTAFKIPNYKKIGTWVKVEVQNDTTGDWEAVNVTLGVTTEVNAWAIDGTNSQPAFTVVDPTVTLPSAPTNRSRDGGADNVRITFAPFSMDKVARFDNPTAYEKGYWNETFVNLLACQAATFQSNRMFIADKYKIYYSDVSNPFSVSDLSWFEIDSEVVGFTRSNSYLAILAKDTGRSTIYLATEESRVVDSEKGTKETYFAVKESNSGIGAVAPKCISILSDEPMFLSRTGVYGILTNWTSEKYAVNRSTRINKRLCQEPNLDKAVGIAFNDYFYLAVNGRMYVLDGRHKESDRAGNKPLEAYVFEGLPAIENMYVIDDRMYFADTTKLYVWNSDLADTERYLNDAYVKTATSVEYQLSDSQDEEPTGEWEDEMPTPSDGEYLWYKVEFDDGSDEITLVEFEVGDEKLDGDPVCARWCSTFDDDDAPQRLKTLMKKGSMVTLVPHYHSECEITLVKDGDEFEYLGTFDSSINSFENINFSSFTFNSNAVAFDNFTKKKIKKYKRLQIQIENNKAEPFGLTQITKTYIFGNYAKR